MTKGKLCDMLINVAKDYKKEGILESLKRNKHMSNYQGEHIKDTVIDALLVDFINYVGRFQGLDLGLYTKHLNEDVNTNE